MYGRTQRYTIDHSFKYLLFLRQNVTSIFLFITLYINKQCLYWCVIHVTRLRFY